MVTNMVAIDGEGGISIAIPLISVAEISQNFVMFAVITMCIASVTMLGVYCCKSVCLLW